MSETTEITHRKLGAPTKRTPSRRAALLDAYRKGAVDKQAAACALISVTLLREWKEDDPELVEEIEAARGQWQLERMEAIQFAGKEPRYWAANAWLLERTDQATYALKGAQSSMPGEGSGVITVNVAVLIQQQLVAQTAAPGILPAPQEQDIVVEGSFRDPGPLSAPLDGSEVPVQDRSVEEAVVDDIGAEG